MTKPGQTPEAIELISRSTAVLQDNRLPKDANGATLAQHEAYLEQLRRGAVPAAVKALVTAGGLATMRQALEDHQELLFHPEAKAILRQNIDQAISTSLVDLYWS